MFISNDGRTVRVGDATFRMNCTFRNVTMEVNGMTANYPFSFIMETEYAGALLMARDKWQEFTKYN